MKPERAFEKERDRILGAYRSRETRFATYFGYFGYKDRAHMYRLYERYQETLSMLNAGGYHKLSSLRILDIGCGDWHMLRQCIQWGANPELLAGIDLRPGAVAEALRLHPGIDVRCGCATQLPWPDRSFDLTIMSTIMTSILDAGMRRTVAGEAGRVLRIAGGIVWYDFIYNSPHNRDIRGIHRREILSLFPGFDIHLRRITLAPVIARRLPAQLLGALSLLTTAVPFLGTHYLGYFVKEE